jgi:hypothetical protein
MRGFKVSTPAGAKMGAGEVHLPEVTQNVASRFRNRWCLLSPRFDEEKEVLHPVSTFYLKALKRNNAWMAAP